jgi:hypothetical protein
VTLEPARNRRAAIARTGRQQAQDLSTNEPAAANTSSGWLAEPASQGRAAGKVDPGEWTIAPPLWPELIDAAEDATLNGSFNGTRRSLYDAVQVLPDARRSTAKPSSTARKPTPVSKPESTPASRTDAAYLLGRLYSLGRDTPIGKGNQAPPSPGSIRRAGPQAGRRQSKAADSARLGETFVSMGSPTGNQTA